MDSNAKGKRGERAWRDELRKRGYQARRGRQFSGSPESPDVVSELDGHVHFEVKWVEHLNIRKAMEQAIHDAGPLALPVVAHKTNGGEWLVTLQAKYWLNWLAHIMPPKASGTEQKGEL